jgi:sulfur relay (sulfurtransferase) DsrF/TusC family protein
MVVTGSSPLINDQPLRRDMPPSIVVVIREDPVKTPRAVEALRIALGLSTGDNPLTVVLLNDSPLLLAEDRDEIADGDILDKHLPVFKEMKTPFVIPRGARTRFSLDNDFQIREASGTEIASLISNADHALVF